MKNILLVVCATLFASGLNAQAVSKGSIIIDPYYGGPNFGKSFAQNFESSNTTNLKVKGLGPFGIRGEYLVADRIGLGVDVIFNNYDLNYTQTDSTYNNTTMNYDYTTSQREYVMNRLRVQARANFHFKISDPNFDSYFGVGVGTNNRFRKAYENGVEVTDDADLGNLTLLPVSFRVCAGFRYYFSDAIGLNMELGLGGPAFSAGLSFRL